MGNELFRKGKSFFALISILSLFLLFNMSLSFADSVGTGSISGHVASNDTSMVVQAIQNLSIITQTNINENGAYSLGLSPGKYGLLFVKNGCEYTYIYKDRVNNKGVNWKNEFENLSEEIEFINLSEDEQLEEYNLDLEKDGPDYQTCLLVIFFRSNVSQVEAADFRIFHNLTLIDEWKPSWSNSLIDTVKLPPDKTALEVAWNLHLLPEVGMAQIQTLGGAILGATQNTNLTKSSGNDIENQYNITTDENNASVEKNRLFVKSSEKSSDPSPFLTLAVAVVLLFALLLKFKSKNEK